MILAFVMIAIFLRPEPIPLPMAPAEARDRWALTEYSPGATPYGFGKDQADKLLSSEKHNDR
jgi:hypothetical protein